MRTKLPSFASYFLIAIAVLIAYGNTFDNAPLYDDEYLILKKNAYITHWASIGDIFTHFVNSGAFRFGQFYRPLQNVLYLMVYKIAGGTSLFGFHLLNLVIHGANGCLVYRLGIKLKFNTWIVFLMALLWSLHPLDTEAVTYMSSTADSLFVFFCLLGTVVVLPDFTWRKMFIAAPIFALALCSKEASIVLPLLIMCCMYYMMPGRYKIKTYALTAPLWVVAGIYIAGRFIFIPFHGNEFLNSSPAAQEYGAHVIIRIYTFLATIPSYIGLIVWPVGLHMDRDFPAYLAPWFWQVGVGLLLLIAALASLICIRDKRWKPLNWGLLWYGCSQIPQTGILVPVNSLFLEHWMYLPTVGLFLGIGQTTYLFLHNDLAKKCLATATLACSLVLGVLTYQQNTIWYSPDSFYLNIINHGELAVRAHQNLAIVYMDRGEYDAAMEQLRASTRVAPPTAETYQDMAALLGHMPGNHVDEEIRDIKKALEINPEFLPACDSLADMYTYLSDNDQATYYRNKANSIRAKYTR
jgi:tetratricopeptide (TPR) repeat protein